ncbi:hypothetical protein LR48_Vigan10g211500 [Vigna angularis]|uniref:Transposase MuDR plant domain-containing protein n=1 Tax=Phaseolus angularis TaxID=3914 RepID=A0A0L9VMN6_PHAAN|nr:hypothetical protein LR48_Vigan10g211500 [Vigna angularis]
MHMINLARLNSDFHLFVVHTTSKPEVIHLLENVPHNRGEVEVEPVMHDSGETVGIGDDDYQEQGEVNDVQVERGEVRGHGEEGDYEESVPVSEERCEGDDIVQGEIETEFDVGEYEGDGADVRSSSSSGEDANVDGNLDVNDDCMEDMVDCDIEDKVGHEVGNCFGDIEVDVQYDGPSWTQMSDSDLDDDINTDDDRSLFDDDWESKELVSGAESDGEDYEEESYGKFVTFCMPKTMVDYKLDLGTYFADKQDFLDAIKTYAVENGRNIRYLKTDKKRIRVKCMGAKGKFPWMAYYAYMDAILEK